MAVSEDKLSDKEPWPEWYCCLRRWPGDTRAVISSHIQLPLPADSWILSVHPKHGLSACLNSRAKSRVLTASCESVERVRCRQGPARHGALP